MHEEAQWVGVVDIILVIKHNQVAFSWGAGIVVVVAAAAAAVAAATAIVR